MRKAISKAIVFLLLTGLAATSYAEPTVTEKLEEKYFSTLDDWVKEGGQINEVQSTVVQTCGKLVILTVSDSEKLSLSTTRREDFDFRVDVCVQMTVNRIHPQPQFKKTDIVQRICDNNTVVVFKKLCRRSGLR